VEAAACARHATGYTYARREPEKTALFQVLQRHLLTFEQEWTDKSDGRTLPSFVTEELHGFLACGILARGFAHLFCKTCHEHYVVPFSCKARAASRVPKLSWQEDERGGFQPHGSRFA